VTRVEQLTVGSLFSGIGGFDLGLERAGMRVVWQVENDAYCRKVLAKHWPGVPCYKDVHDVGAHNTAEVDVICGGFPCQPVSVAGKQLAQEDERWLWPQFARIIRELRPRYAIVENVPGLLVRGMGDVLGDLASLGYDAEWGIISAASVGAPHLRKRVFVIGYAANPNPKRNSRHPAGRSRGGDKGNGQADEAEGRRRVSNEARRLGAGESGTHGSVDVADTDSARLDRCPQRDIWPAAGVETSQRDHSDGLGMDQRTPWYVEPNVGRVADGVPKRMDRLRALGNAIVPQVAEWVGKRIVSAL